ncbi:hypothetical protein AURDEDRAFT_76586, partial [Auricularia subglabra TFB-10046 SS5]
MKLPKSHARKLTPKYIGPFKIIEVIEKGATYKLQLSREMLKRGIHSAFHASLLREYVPNDDIRFPGRQWHQILGLGERPTSIQVRKIVAHFGQGKDAQFEVQWSTGEST